MKLTLTPNQPIATRKRDFFTPNPAPPTYAVYPNPFAGTIVSASNRPSPYAGLINYKGSGS